MYHLIDNFTNTKGDALVGYYVKLKVPGGAYATLFADVSSTPIISVSGVADTAITDAIGQFSLYVADGSYDIEFFDAADPTQRVRTISSVPMFGFDTATLANIAAASGFADTATAQAGVATTQAGIATTQAGVATTQAGVATTQAGVAVAASVLSGYYTTVAAGALATTSPDTFLSDEGGQLTLYDADGNSIEGVATSADIARYQISTVSALQALTPIEGDTAYLRLDGRAGMFVFSTSNWSVAVTADTTQSIHIAPSSDATGASGAWNRVHNGTIYSRHFDFGKSGNTATQNRAGLQACCDYAKYVYKNGGGILEIIIEGNRSAISIDGPIFLFDFSTPSFSLITYNIRGITGYASAGSPVITITDGSQCAFIVQNNRATCIRGLYIRGQLPSDPSTATVMIDDTAPWYNPTGSLSDHQYKPHCGISIDPFSLDVTTGNHYTGLSAYYTQNVGSNTVTIEDCTFYRLMVGIGWNTSRYSPQGDGFVSNRNKFISCKVTHAVGQSQSRACTIRDIFVNACTTLVDCNNYGQTIGNFPEIIGGQATIVKQVFIADGARNSAHISGLYGEELWRIGKWAGSIFPMTMDSCQFKLLTPSTHSIAAPDALMEASGPVNFNGGSIYINDAKKHDLNMMASSLVTFNGTSLNGFIMGGENTSNDGSLSFNNCALKAHTSGSSYGLSESLGHCRSSVFSAFAIAHKGAMLTRRDIDGNLEFQKWKSLGTPVIILDTSVTVTVATDGTATFTSADYKKYRVDEYVQSQLGWTPDPYLRTGAVAWTGNYLSMGRVKTIDSGTGLITLEHVPKGLATGTRTIMLTHPGYFRARCMATTTNASPTITMSDNTFQVGDRIRGTGIPAGAHIISISHPTATLSHNCTATGTVECKTADLVIEDAWRLVGGTLTNRTLFRGDKFAIRGDTASITNGMIPTYYYCKASGSTPTISTLYLSENNPAT